MRVVIHRFFALAIMAWTLFWLYAIIWIPRWLFDHPDESPPLFFTPIMPLTIFLPIWAAGMVPLGLVCFFTRRRRTPE